MRETIQAKLNELNDIESGIILSDDIVEDNQTYFGYELSKTYINTDLDKNYTYRVSLTGYVTRRMNTSENTVAIVDNATDRIMSKLKSLNFKCNNEDVSISNNIRKMAITGYTEYNEINNNLIV